MVAMVMKRGRLYDTTDKSAPRIAAICVAQAATPNVPQPCMHGIYALREQVYGMGRAE